MTPGPDIFAIEFYQNKQMKKHQLYKSSSSKENRVNIS